MFGISRSPTRSHTDRIIYRRNIQHRQRARPDGNFHRYQRGIVTMFRCSLVSATLITVFVGALHLEQSPYFNVSQVTVLGTYLLERDMVVREVDIAEGTNTFQVNLEHIRLRVLENPYVKGAIVRRELPGTIVIEVIERKPLAQLLLHNKNYLISDDGIVLEEVVESDGYNYPIIVNVSSDTIELGEHLKQYEFDVALSVLHVLRDVFPELYSRLQVIEIHKVHKVVLRFRGLDGAVCIGTTMIENSLQQFVGLVPKLSRMTFKAIDLRFHNKAIITF